MGALFEDVAVNAAVSFLIPNALFFAVYGRNPLFLESIRQIKGVLLKKSGTKKA